MRLVLWVEAVCRLNPDREGGEERMPKKTQVIHREVDKGRFVTKEYADKHKKTTEREVRKK
jgi:hypothetical protein